jgi:hypothetical protein
MWFIYTMVFYSAIRQNEIISFADKWMEWEDIMLSEVSQVQKNKGHMLSLICVRQIPKIKVTQKQK